MDNLNQTAFPISYQHSDGSPDWVNGFTKHEYAAIMIGSQMVSGNPASIEQIMLDQALRYNIAKAACSLAKEILNEFKND